MGAYASIAVLLLCGFTFLRTEISWAYLAALRVLELHDSLWKKIRDAVLQPASDPH
jgi:hypothetical protein